MSCPFFYLGKMVKITVIPVKLTASKKLTGNSNHFGMKKYFKTKVTYPKMAKRCDLSAGLSAKKKKKHLITH